MAQPSPHSEQEYRVVELTCPVDDPESQDAEVEQRLLSDNASHRFKEPVQVDRSIPSLLAEPVLPTSDAQQPSNNPSAPLQLHKSMT